MCNLLVFRRINVCNIKNVNATITLNHNLFDEGNSGKFNEFPLNRKQSTLPYNLILLSTSPKEFLATQM